MSAVIEPNMPAREAAITEHYAYLMAHRSGYGTPLDDPLARMLASQALDVGAMPQRLGLDKAVFRQLMTHYFPGAVVERFDANGPQFDRSRLDESEDLITLYLAHRRDETPIPDWFATILAVGCLGSDHLWQDLGLWSRKDLSLMINHAFPALAAKNDRDMKWKKFFYKQLCNQEGVYTCRAPSCEVCADYLDCFGPEE